MPPVRDEGGRQIWREARACISEYEAQAAELNLDYQTELKSIQACKERIASVKRDINQIRNSCQKMDMAWRLEVGKALDLRKQTSVDSEDTQRLAHQLTTARNDLSKAQDKETSDKKLQDEHIAKMRSHLQKLQDQQQALAAASSLAECA